MLPRDKSTPEAIANFTREIRALASLDHPKLVGALDAGEDGNVHYLVTEYVPGLDLRKLVRREGPLSMSAAASIICQVAEGLEYAHAQGIVHRDVKPGNVLVSPEGEAKLSDLGLAGPLAGEPETDPRYGKIVGTADYLSPDQVRDPWNPTPAWDIYSLGCTLYYAVTGKVPFPGGTTADKARAHCELRPLDPRRLNPQLSSGVRRGHGRHDGQGSGTSDCFGAGSHRAADAFLVRATGISGTGDGRAGCAAARCCGAARSAAADRRNAARRSAVAEAAGRPGRSPAWRIRRTTFPACPSRRSARIVPAGQMVKTFDLSRGVDEDDSRSVEISLSVQRDLMAVLWPLTAFVLAPLTLAGGLCGCCGYWCGRPFSSRRRWFWPECFGSPPLRSARPLGSGGVNFSLVYDSGAGRAARAVQTRIGPAKLSD